MPIKLVAIDETESHHLMHYRTKGSKNGVRRWQYKDGSLTPEGRIHYGVGKPREKSGNVEEVVKFLSKVRYKEFDKLMSAEDVRKTKSGSCHDQVMYEVAELRKLGVEPKVRFLIESDDDNHGGATHSFVWFNKDGKVFWLENAWGGQEGLRSYSNESQMMKDVWKRWEKNDKYPYLYDGNIDPNTMKPGMDLGDLLDIVEFYDD